MHPLFQSRFGYADPLRIVDPAAAAKADDDLDEALRLAGYPEAFPHLNGGAPRHILAALLACPERLGVAKRNGISLKASRHDVSALVDSRRGVWKFVKLNEAFRAHGADADWLMIVDDDVSFPADFLDRFIAAAEAAGLVLAQPAHKIHSYASYAVTQRKPRSIVRTSHFVEIGPMVAIHRSIFGALLPFPENKSGWGIDFIWADLAQRHRWRIGVVDATPFEHLQPVASSYDKRHAMEEASILLDMHAPAITRDLMLSEGAVAIGW